MVNLKKAYFKDGDDNLEKVMIGINEGVSIFIDSYTDDDKTGYLNLYFHPNKKIYLNPIYCYSKYRGLGVAKNLSDIADYLLKDYEDYTIIGIYKPGIMLDSFDEYASSVSEEYADRYARAFYKRAGYDILSQAELIDNPDKYYYIDMDKDFKNNSILEEDEIICKQIIKQDEYNYIEEDDVLTNIFLYNKKKDVKVLTKKQ